MAAQDYTAVVQQLYISYFGRPADYFGLQNFSAQLDAMGAPKTFAEVQAAVQADAAGTTALSKLVNTFNNSEESIALYGNDNSQIGISRFVANIYQNVLGREADTAGFNFWVNAITSGALSKANAAAAITQGALNNTSDQGKLDALTVQHKLSVATAFTDALDTPTEFNAYAGEDAAATGRSLLQGVNSSTDVTAYQSNINDAINTIVNVSVPGSTTGLTIGVDTFNGTAGDDVFNAIPQNAQGTGANTLGAFDTIDGGAGKDTLNIYTGTGTVDGAAAKFNVVQQGTVKNVETINIYNQTGAVFGTTTNGTTTVDASKFVGATNINQVGLATGVTKLAAGTTATFTNVSATGATALSVAAADAATSAKVALSGVTGATANNQATLNVSGASLSSVTVSGSIAQADPEGDDAASLALNVKTGASSTGVSVSTLTVNTAVKTTLTVDDTDADSGNVTTIDASASTGGITFAGGTAAVPEVPADEDGNGGSDAVDAVATKVLTIRTGTGNDNINAIFATAAAAGSDAAKNASISTGAGKDTITVVSTGSGGSITVDAGAGDDTINVTKTAGVALNIMGGEGNDTIALTGTLATTDVIDGGAGTDTISVAGSKTARTADDFIVFNKLVKNFETLKLTGVEGSSTVSFDASKLAATYTTINLGAGSYIEKVGSQAIVANGDLHVSASGYSAATVAAGSTPAKDAVYAGTLNITEKATGTVTANADIVKLTVSAGTTAAGVVGTLAGDAQSAIVTVTNGLTADGETDTVAKFVLNNSATDAALKSVTVSGTGSATITNADDTALVSVDASGLGGKYTVGTDAGKAIAGLEYISTNTAAETIKLGAGVDKISLGASNYGAIDTVTGLNLVLAADGKSLDAKSDSLILTGVTTTDVVKFTTTQTDLDLALKDAAAAMTSTVHTVVFALGGDTYIYHDATTGTVGGVDAADTIVKLTGTIDQNALIVDLGGKVA
ncbi:DUF4214 domain-containing protein [Massilia sp. YIM B02763]|uniref:DUF4214 domain-containing protein n=1 Tax=Massilia sp. YIM B02763 TaxID=3050130 RepID=UPI0025B67B3B|nr:DUF4214 domain-containing protein [Massilia sp. YIM B02763]MDN4054639.1 DUF4214 domain-containing protein [Massilia sp. YIM B02763]